jgi:glycosyltransferase involved in cell wall biosynthesis
MARHDPVRDHDAARAHPRKLGIAHVLTSLGMGGQERIALDLAAGQVALGHAVVAISLAPEPGGRLADEFQARGIEVAHMPKRRRVDGGAALRLRALLRARGVDVVHTHNPQPLIYGAVAGRAAGARVIHTKHGMNPAGAKQRLARRLAASLTDAFVAVSEHTGEVARRGRECAATRLHVVPNGIDISRFGADAKAREEARAELGVAPDAFVVGTVGRLYLEKGHEALLRAAAPLLSDRFHVVIIGEGPEAERLSALVRSLPAPSSVHLLGARRDVPRLLAALDAFALTSLREGLPLVVPEAMAVELPVIATAVGGLPSVVDHERTGYLVELGDTRALRERLAQLDQDRALARRLGRQGRERALAEFSSEAMLARYMRIYEAALATGRR